MNHTKIVSRIVGLIDIDESTGTTLSAIEPLLTAVPTQSSDAPALTSNSGQKLASSSDFETVYYKANLSHLARQLEGELYNFRSLFARAKSLQRAASL